MVNKRPGQANLRDPIDSVDKESMFSSEFTGILGTGYLFGFWICSDVGEVFGHLITVDALHQQKYEDLVSTHYYSLSPKAAKADPGYSPDCN